MLINEGLDKNARYRKLHGEAQRQLSTLIASKLRIQPIKDDQPSEIS